jgi:hypothetical protein
MYHNSITVPQWIPDTQSVDSEDSTVQYSDLHGDSPAINKIKKK